MKKIKYLTLTGIAFAVAASHAAVTTVPAFPTVPAGYGPTIPADQTTPTSSLSLHNENVLPPSSGNFYTAPAGPAGYEPTIPADQTTPTSSLSLHNENVLPPSSQGLFSCGVLDYLNHCGGRTKLRSKMDTLFATGKVDVNYMDAENELTPLHLAVEYKDYELIEYLLEKGADLFIRGGNFHRSPITIVYRELHEAQKEKAQLEKIKREERSQLAIADLARCNSIEQSSQAMTRIFHTYLLTKGLSYEPSINLDSFKSLTIVHRNLKELLSKRNYSDIRQALASGRISADDINLQDHYGNTLLMTLLKHGDQTGETLELAHLLITKFNAKDDIATFGGITLHEALIELHKALEEFEIKS